MTRVVYDLTDPEQVNAYLDRVKGEHNPSFERWRQRRVSQGAHKFVVVHPEGEPKPPTETRFPSRGYPDWRLLTWATSVWDAGVILPGSSRTKSR